MQDIHNSSERIGDIVLDADLEPGEYRPLTAEEIASIGLPKELQAK